MSHKSASEARSAAAEAARTEQTLRQRWEGTQGSIRERIDEPIQAATRLTQRTLAWFPVRVWRHFLQNNGFLLGAGISYQGLFAIFAAIYVTFAVTGLWLGGNTEAVNAVITLINSYIPGLIGPQGVITTAEVQEIASNATGALSITGLIAFGAVIWTAIGWVTYSRRGVRDMFGIPPDRRSYVLLKARDLAAALIFGAALIVGAALTWVSSWALSWLLSLFGIDLGPGMVDVSIRIGSVIVSFAINAAALAALFRFLTDTSLQWRMIWPGALLGGAALTVLQFSAGVLVSYTPSNPLLATFAIFVGLLLWFKISGIIMLVAAAWIAVASQDKHIPISAPSEAEQIAAEHRALLLAAQVRLRAAREARATAPWYRAWRADFAVREAEDELREVEASAPPPRPAASAHAARAAARKATAVTPDPDPAAPVHTPHVRRGH
ncbi:YihY/virulence factor BrkB family protein [Microbacterium sp. zg.B48]|uniref:YihY/virulence factor BrkB family protein n=1 Tax=Microbacterium sp. zg.B48 TaxID=2969408 RepID=UPI00214ABF07|nr:YihY/virulence factor BrkB family protein [Microbacterium sp. zg.B48]MCR2763982.1 YihY/virulence factor BrkB family protein [Microbacterium sp. zg.B48]